ncbi:MAG: hypothetical protein JW928_07955 [Candidatus Aureabacteria bacterium]|nr:hypothetical protein [Candidatus Auribacterota bacterium]
MFFCLIQGRLSASDYIIGEDELHQLLKEELQKNLSRETLFTPLPNNLKNVMLSPAHDPVFIMSKGDSYHRAPFDKVLKSVLSSEDTFRLMIDGEVIGWGDGGEIVITGDSTQKGAIVDKDNVIDIRIPKGLKYQEAYQLKGQWFYRTSEGIGKEGLDPIIPKDVIQNVKVINTGENLIVLPVRYFSDKPGDYDIYLIRPEGETFEKFTYKNLPFGGIQGALRCEDGRWIVIGSKISFFKEEFDAEPKEEDIRAVLEAVKNKEQEKLKTLLANISLFPHQYFQELLRQLRDMPVQYRNLMNIESSFISYMSSIRNINVADETQDEKQREKIKKVLDNSLERMRKSIKELDEITEMLSPFSPQRIVELLSRQFQYFDGQWIGNIRVLEADNANAALLMLNYADNDSGEILQGIFHLGNDGHLKEICSSEESIFFLGGHMNFVRDNQGRMIFFAPQKGLFLVDQGKLTKIDQSPTMKAMQNLLGCDRHGRLYFSQNRTTSGHIRYSGRQIWVYKEGFEGLKEEPVKQLPAGVTTVLDSKKRIWFVGYPHQPDIFSGLILSSRSEQKSVEFIEKEIVWPNRKDIEEVMKKDDTRQYLDRQGGNVFCYENEKLCRYPVNADQSEAQIIPGKSDSVYICSRSNRLPTYVIEENKIWEGKDLHELAEKNFDLLLRTAPDRCYIEGVSLEEKNAKGNTKICNYKDIIWICDNNKIEAYKDAKPLFIQKRLELDDGRTNISSPKIFGPVILKGKEKMMIMTNPSYVQDIFWAILGKEGISIERSPEPSWKWPDCYRLTDPGKLACLPLVDFESGRVFYYNGGDRVWSTIDGKRYARIPYSGIPVFVEKEKDMVVFRNEDYYGYRFMGKDICDIKETYVKDLEIIYREKDGQVVCLGPEGIVWLEPDDELVYNIIYEKKIDPRYNLLDCIGKVGEDLYVLSMDDKRRFCIIVIERLPKSETKENET